MPAVSCHLPVWVFSQVDPAEALDLSSPYQARLATDLLCSTLLFVQAPFAVLQRSERTSRAAFLLPLQCLVDIDLQLPAKSVAFDQEVAGQKQIDRIEHGASDPVVRQNRRTWLQLRAER